MLACEKVMVRIREHRRDDAAKPPPQLLCRRQRGLSDGSAHLSPAPIATEFFPARHANLGLRQRFL
eukprot:1033693-Rhodomonas_salina.1